MPTAFEIAARQFGSTWTPGENPPDAYVTIDGKRRAVDAAMLPSHAAASGAKARFRDDRVARRVLADVEAAPASSGKTGKAVIFTLGAPIAQPAKLIEALIGELTAAVASSTLEHDEHRRIFGNRIRYRVIDNASAWIAPATGFVFTGDAQPETLAAVMRAMHETIAAHALRPARSKIVDDRWLLLIVKEQIADLAAYKRACEHLIIPSVYDEILLLGNNGRATVAQFSRR